MSPWFILFLSKLDAVMTTAGIILTIYLIVMSIMFCGVFFVEDDAAKDFLANNTKKLIAIPAVCIFILLTVPSRNTAILMWVLPKLSQSQLIQKDFPEMYEKAMKILNEEIEKKLNGDKK